MSNVEIPVSANVSSVQKGVQDIAKTIEQANRIKWNPIDLEQIKRDAKAAQQILKEHGLGGDLGPRVPGRSVTVTPPPPPPPSGEVEPPTPAGIVGRLRRRHRYTFAPDLTDVGRNILGGLGGGFGTIASYATRGAAAGAYSGGFSGGSIGLLRGLGIGALAFGALKAGQSINEGYGMAKERAITLDTVKRQMGDLGISINALKIASEGAGDAIGLNAKETAKLMEEFTKLSRGVDKTEEALMSSTITSGRVARAFGIDPSTSAGFFAGTRHIDPKQNNRELALLIAEATNRSGMNARVDEVMQAIKSFAATTARMSLTSPNLNAFAGAYSDLVGMRSPGLDSEASAALLAQANASIMRMGGAGEAGHAFILAALNRHGVMNPIQAMALAQGGLFGTRRGVFDPSGEIAKFVGPGRVAAAAGGASADVTNFQAIRQHLARLGGDKWFQLEGAQRLFGVSSLSHAAALMNMSGSELGGLQKALQRAGLKPEDVNETGLPRLARIGSASTSGELAEVFRDMIRSGDLKPDERERLESISGGNMEEFRNALLQIAASKGQEQTEGSKTRDQIAQIETAITNVGDRLLTPMNTMRNALLVMAGKGGETSLRKLALEMDLKDANEFADSQIKAVAGLFGSKRTAVRRGFLDDKSNRNELGYLTPEASQSMRDQLDELSRQEQAEISRINQARKERIRALEEADHAALRTAAGGPLGATPLPVGATAGGAPPGTAEHIVIDSKHVVQTVGSDGRVISEKASSTHVSRPRGSGTTRVSHDPG